VDRKNATEEGTQGLLQDKKKPRKSNYDGAPAATVTKGKVSRKTKGGRPRPLRGASRKGPKKPSTSKRRNRRMNPLRGCKELIVQDKKPSVKNQVGGGQFLGVVGGTRNNTAKIDDGCQPVTNKKPVKVVKTGRDSYHWLRTRRQKTIDCRKKSAVNLEFTKEPLILNGKKERIKKNKGKISHLQEREGGRIDEAEDRHD